MSATIEDLGTVKKVHVGRLFWPILRGIALIVALWAFIAFFPVLLVRHVNAQEGKWGTAVVVFVLASFALIWMAFKPETLPAIEGEGTEQARQHRLPDWSLSAYGVIIGLGCNWACAFLWFSRRYAFFSGPVVGATGLIMALYAAIALLVARLTGGNWRTALLVFALAPVNLAGLILRWGLLR
jgi:hypothetical protein